MALKNKHICVIASHMNCCSNILVYPVNRVVNHDGVFFITTFTILRLRCSSCKFDGNIIWARNNDTIVSRYLICHVLPGIMSNGTDQLHFILNHF